MNLLAKGFNLPKNKANKFHSRNSIQILKISMKNTKRLCLRLSIKKISIWLEVTIKSNLKDSMPVKKKRKNGVNKKKWLNGPKTELNSNHQLFFMNWAQTLLIYTLCSTWRLLFQKGK